MAVSLPVSYGNNVWGKKLSSCAIRIAFKANAALALLTHTGIGHPHR